jgi:hypothetical protein
MCHLQDKEQKSQLAAARLPTEFAALNVQWCRSDLHTPRIKPQRQQQQQQQPPPPNHIHSPSMCSGDAHMSMCQQFSHGGSV